MDDRILTQSLSIFYPLLMITFLSMTLLYEFHVKIYHSSRSKDFICNFLITEYSNKKHHKYQVHYISQSKKDSVIVSRDVTCDCDTFLTKIPIAPCYCQMMGRTLKEEIKITQYNNTTKAGKYSLEDLFRASDNIPHHYPKF